MQFNELIEKDGIEAVSQKTNVSVENLSSLYEQNFDKLNRVKALGFINILEREYPDIEIDDLREVIKGYYDSHKDAKDDEVVMVTQNMKNESAGGLGFLKWLVLAGIIYGIWYLYNTGKLGNFSASEQEETQLNDRTALKSSVSESAVENIQIKEDGENGKTVKIETKATEINTTDSPLEESAEKVVLSETNATVESLNEANGTASASTENATEGEESNASTPDTEDNATVAIENLTINPTRGMLWYGFINIDTKERREFMNKVSTPFELNGGRWILMTGHGYVDIVSEAETIEKADRVKHYFYIDSHEIREIDRKEFRKLNGGRGW
ncbi:MAG TPA: hypothetical protein ENK86_07120 [Campylobacterales bacterium]|nr:hypothetical protein [Campylobacterales bacterium]